MARVSNPETGTDGSRSGDPERGTQPDLRATPTELDRRQLLSLLPLLPGVHLVTGSQSPVSDPYHHWSVGRLAETIRKKEVSARQVVEHHLQRIEAVNPRLNAVVQVVADRALAEARRCDQEAARGKFRGPLHGVPMTIKDSFDTEGIVTTGGTLGRRSYVPRKDATIVSRLRAAGAILVGKSNTPELTLNFETVNQIYGRTSNPYDLQRTPGGSSGGAAAIVAAGGVAFDIGTDTGGSIRLPAHYCGVAGMKPTSGSVPRSGHIVPWGMGALDSWTHVGPLTRTVEDLPLLLNLIAGPDFVDPQVWRKPELDYRSVRLKGLRVAFHTENGLTSASPEVDRVCRQVAARLADAGMKVEETRPSVTDQSHQLFYGILLSDGASGVRRMLRAAGTPLEQSDLRGMVESARNVPASDYTGWLVRLDRFRSAMLQFMKSHDLLLCPCNSLPALRHGETSKFADTFSFLPTYNLTGWPVVTVRAGKTPAGLPIGVQLVARPWEDRTALAAARLVEQELGGWVAPGL